MARIDTTKPEVVSALILDALTPNLVYGDYFNMDYQGDLGPVGTQVTINSISDLTISDYSGATSTLTYEDIETTGQTMIVDLSKTFSFRVLDDDTSQSVNKGILDKATEKAGFNLAKVYDEYLRDKLLSEATLTADLGDDTTPLEISDSGLTPSEFFALIARKLDETDLPREGRIITIPPVLLESLYLDTATKFTENMDIMSNGIIGNLAGFQVRVTNQVDNTDGAQFKIIASSPMCATRAVQLSNTELLRLESKFGTGCRGILTGAAKATRPEAVAVATVNVG